MWTRNIFPRENETRVAGQTHKMDDVQGWVYLLRRLNNPHLGLLAELEQLANGQLSSRYLQAAGSSSGRIEPGPDLPKRIRLAHACFAFLHELDEDTEVTRSDAEDWLDVPRVELYRNLELNLKEEIFQAANRLDFALRRDAFKSALANFTPFEFMSCFLDLAPILVQAGKPESIENLFIYDQHKQIFELFELADPDVEELEQILNVRFHSDGSVRWNTREIKTVSDADALKADITAPKKLLSTYKLYRDHVLPLLVVQQLKANTSIVDFKTEIGGLVKRSTLPFYPAGALDEKLSLAEFKASAEAFDVDNAGRWSAFDSLLATGLDRAATSTASILGVIDLYLAVEKIVSEPELTATSLKDLMVAGLSFADDGLARLAANSAMLSGEMGEGLKTLSTTLSKKVVQRALFVFAIMDVATQVKSVGSSVTKAEEVGNALILAGGVASVGASGLQLLATAGIVTVGAGPVVALALVGAALGLLGWAVVALFHQNYPEQILRGSFFRKDPDDRTVALEADKEAVDLRTGFVEEINGNVTENLALQIAYVVGLTRGFRPSARDVTAFFGLGSRTVEYKIETTPYSSTPPSNITELDFASSVYITNLDFDNYGNPLTGSMSNRITQALFRDFEIPFTAGTVGEEEPPLEFEVRTRFKTENLTFEPIGIAIKRWLSEKIIEEGGVAPEWQPPDPERLAIRERARAV